MTNYRLHVPIWVTEIPEENEKVVPEPMAMSILQWSGKDRLSQDSWRAATLARCLSGVTVRLTFWPPRSCPSPSSTPEQAWCSSRTGLCWGLWDHPGITLHRFIYCLCVYQNTTPPLFLKLPGQLSRDLRGLPFCSWTCLPPVSFLSWLQKDKSCRDSWGPNTETSPGWNKSQSTMLYINWRAWLPLINHYSHQRCPSFSTVTCPQPQSAGIRLKTS